MNIGDEVIISAKVVGITESNNPIIQVKSGVRMLIKESDIKSNLKGKWLVQHKNDEEGIYLCSNCKSRLIIYDDSMECYRFCPNCGCSMKGGVK